MVRAGVQVRDVVRVVRPLDRTNYSVQRAIPRGIWARPGSDARARSAPPGSRSSTRRASDPGKTYTMHMAIY